MLHFACIFPLFSVFMVAIVHYSTICIANTIIQHLNCISGNILFLSILFWIWTASQTAVQREANDWSKMAAVFLTEQHFTGHLAFILCQWLTHTPRLCFLPYSKVMFWMDCQCECQWLWLFFLVSWFCFPTLGFWGSGKVATCPSLVNSALHTAAPLLPPLLRTWAWLLLTAQSVTPVSCHHCSEAAGPP